MSQQRLRGRTIVAPRPKRSLSPCSSKASTDTRSTRPRWSTHEGAGVDGPITPPATQANQGVRSTGRDDVSHRASSRREALADLIQLFSTPSPVPGASPVSSRSSRVQHRRRESPPPSSPPPPPPAAAQVSGGTITHDLDTVDHVGEVDLQQPVAAPDGDESEYTHEVGSETSDADGVFQDVDEWPKRERCVESLYRLLKLQDFGCGEAAHREAAHEHNLNVVDHHDLSATYDTQQRHGFVRKLVPGTPIAGLHADSFPRVDTMPRKQFISDVDIQRVMEGAPVPGDGPAHICLHQEFQPEVEPRVTWDVDSLLALPATLGAFKQDIRLAVTKQPMLNISTDVHVTYPVQITQSDGTVEQEMYPLKKIPHLYLGHVPSWHNGSIFLFLPGLADRKNSSTSIVEDVYVRAFYDRALLPALKKFNLDATTAHVAPTARVAQDKARAKGREQLTIERERNLHQHVSTPVRARDLDDVWAEVEAAIHDPTNDLAAFEGSFLFFNVKNMKDDTRRETPRDALRGFYKKLRASVDLGKVKRWWADFAVELTPPQARDPSSETINIPVPTTYFWRTCCLERVLFELRRRHLGGFQGNVKRYHNGLLRDLTCMTLEPPKSSPAAEEGLVYAQWYVVCKEVGDAQQVHPFANPELHDLALDRNLYESITGGTRRASLEGSYVQSKRRLREATQAYAGNSMGVRFEVRLTGAGFDELCAIADADVSAQGRASPTELPGNPEFVWSLPTRRWTEFVRGNVHKFTSLIEMAIMTSPATGVERPVAEVVSCLIRCLQGFQNVDVTRHPLLNHVQRPKADGRPGRPRKDAAPPVDGGSRADTAAPEGPQTEYGLGVGHNLRTYGYGWFEPVCDWDTFRIRAQYYGSMIGLGLERAYRPRARLMHGVRDQVDHCYSVLRTPGISKVLEYYTLHALAHFVVRQYRRDVLDRLAHMDELRAGVARDQAAMDGVYFCHDGLAAVVAEPVHLIRGNKTGCKTVDSVFRWLMGTNGEEKDRCFNRGVMDGEKANGVRAAWRVMVHVANGAMVDHSVRRSVDWRKVLLEVFTESIWLLPYPNAETGSFISPVCHAAESRSRRQYWSLVRGDHGRAVWGRGGYMPGFPARYPPFLDMDLAGFKDYLSQTERRSAGTVREG